MARTRTRNRVQEARNDKARQKLALKVKQKASKRPQKLKRKTSVAAKRSQQKKWCEKARKRQEGIKADPKRLEIQRAKERNRWRERVQAGKVKAVSDMTRRDLNQKRERNRLSSQKYRQKFKSPKVNYSFAFQIFIYIIHIC